MKIINTNIFGLNPKLSTGAKVGGVILVAATAAVATKAGMLVQGNKDLQKLEPGSKRTWKVDASIDTALMGRAARETRQVMENRELRTENANLESVIRANTRETEALKESLATLAAQVTELNKAANKTAATAAATTESAEAVHEEGAPEVEVVAVESAPAAPKAAKAKASKKVVTRRAETVVA